MGAKHLNLEFEEEDESLTSAEEEVKRKREEEEKKAKMLAQEIEFIATDPNITISKKDLKQPAPSQQPTSPPQASKPQQAAVKPAPAAPIKRAELAEVRPPVQAPISRPVAPVLDSGRNYSSVEVEALIRAAVAESRLEYITDMAAEIKLLEHKANKILTMIFTKVPALKNEVMQVQKLLSDHNQSVIPRKKD